MNYFSQLSVSSVTDFFVLLTCPSKAICENEAFEIVNYSCRIFHVISVFMLFVITLILPRVKVLHFLYIITLVKNTLSNSLQLIF